MKNIGIIDNSDTYKLGIFLSENTKDPDTYFHVIDTDKFTRLFLSNLYYRNVYIYTTNKKMRNPDNHQVAICSSYAEVKAQMLEKCDTCFKN